MTRTISALVMALGLVALVVVAWFYLEDRQQAASAGAGQTTSAGLPASGSAQDTSRPSTPADQADAGGSRYIAQDQGEGGVIVRAAVLTPGTFRKDPTLAEIAASVDSASELGVFVTFETHAGDLSKLDLVALSSLEGPDGSHAALRWVAEDDSSHHRSGMLVFERSALDLAAVGKLSLTMADVGGVPSRTLTWNLPLP